MQLTGQRLNDHFISDSDTVGGLLRAVDLHPESKKLHSTTEMQKIKRNIPNVQVYMNRRTPLHKDREVGRWKLIEQELITRDLPVLKSRLQGMKEVMKNER